MQESDITFLQRLCKAAGISLKVTAKIIVLFDAADYEQKDAVRTIQRGGADVGNWSFSTSLHDASYSKCHVSYTDPNTGTTIEYTYTPRDADESGQVLEVNEKVSTREEARQLAMKRLRQKNKGEFKASFKLAGDLRLVAGGYGAGCGGYGAFDGEIHHRNGNAQHFAERVQNRRDLAAGFGGLLMSELSVLKNIVRTGWVSSVNEAERTARVHISRQGARADCLREFEGAEKPALYSGQKRPAEDRRRKRRRRRRGLCLPQSRRHNQTVATVSGRLCALYLSSDG